MEDRQKLLIEQAKELIIKTNRATASHLQRNLHIGYNRAALILEELENAGIVGPQIGTEPRKILISQTVTKPEKLEQIKAFAEQVLADTKIGCDAREAYDLGKAKIAKEIINIINEGEA